MPMFKSRVAPLAASLVWRVEKIRCPVSEVRMASSAVSRSRTSPTITMSGSWRRMLRSAEAKVSPISGLT